MSSTRLAIVMIALVIVACTGGQTANDGIGTPPSASGTYDPETLVVALLPDEDPAAILQHHRPFADYLERTLGRKVELTVHHDYSVLVESMRSGYLHLAYFGPATYILTKDAGTHIEPFAAKVKGGSTTYTGLIIAQSNGSVSTVEDLRGKRMAYGDPGSTSSHLIPKHYLLERGLRPTLDYEEVFFGAHDAVALNVANGNADAGGLSAGIYRALIARATIDPSQTTIIAESAPFPQYPWAMRSDLDPALKTAIRQAFHDLKDPEILRLMDAEGFGSISDADYEIVRQLERAVEDYR